MDRILVWGCGGHGKVVGDLVRACGHELVGYVDADRSRLGQVVDTGGGRLVSTQDELLAALEQGVLPHNATVVALALGDNALRFECARRLGGFIAPPLVHPRSAASPGALLGEGSVVMAGAVVNPAANVGMAAILNSACVVEHDCVLGPAAHVSPGAVLAGAVTVGACSWIGAGAVVIQGVRIGIRAIVGAGAVVLRDVPDDVTVAGVPARVLPADTRRQPPS